MGSPPLVHVNVPHDHKTTELGIGLYSVYTCVLFDFHPSFCRFRVCVLDYVVHGGVLGLVVSFSHPHLLFFILFFFFGKGWCAGEGGT